VFEEVFQFVLTIADEKKLLSGKAVGRNRSSFPNSAAKSRLAVAMCGLPRSRNRTMFLGRTARTFHRWSWNDCWFHLAASSSQSLPVAGFSAPYSIVRSRFPVIGTSACCLTSDQHARSGASR
jgi:hypothetical protein